MHQCIRSDLRLVINGENCTAKLIFGFSEQGQWFYDKLLSDIEKGIIIESADSRTKTGTQDDSLSMIKNTVLSWIFQEDSSKIVDVNGKPEVVQYCTTSEGALLDA